MLRQENVYGSLTGDSVSNLTKDLRPDVLRITLILHLSIYVSEAIAFVPWNAKELTVVTLAIEVKGKLECSER